MDDIDLTELIGSAIDVSAPDLDHEAPWGDAHVDLCFSSGTLLQCSHWRVIEDGRPNVSSFDDRQSYGLPAPVDAIADLRALLEGRIVLEADLDRSTGDLIFAFTGSLRLQIFNFSSYENLDVVVAKPIGRLLESLQVVADET